MLLVAACSKAQYPQSLKVMSWNILHGANDCPDGQNMVVKIIREINPDVVLMVETYGSGKVIADSLGYNFHLIAPKGTPLNDPHINLSILSRFPFGEPIDTEYPFYLGGREILVHGQKIRFFANWFHYIPWDDEPEKLGKTTEELLAWEKSGSKYEMIQKVLPVIEKYSQETDSFPMILGGDLNSPSHLDWGIQTKSDHNGLVVPWYSTKVLEDIGLVDSYRKLNPNPVTHPGITWDMKGVKDEHRIDYIFYKGVGLTPVKSETWMTFFNDSLHINSKKIQYPSDHGIVVTSFQLN